MRTCQKIYLTLFCMLLTAASLAGCASQEAETDPFFDEWRAKAENAQPYLPPRKKIEDAMPLTKVREATVPKGISRVKKQEMLINSLPQLKITVRFIDEELDTILRTMARLARQNIIISPNVTGKVNLHIEETPWNTVFMGLVNTYGLSVNKEDNLLHVISMDDLKQQLEKKSLLVEEEQISPLTTRIVPIEFSAPDSIISSITPLLSMDKEGKARGSVTSDPHSRSLVIRDTAENINRLIKLVYDLDKPTPQILIKAHIVETTKDMARELGIQWGAMSTNSVLTETSMKMTPGDTSATWDTTTGSLIHPAAADTAIGNNLDMAASSLKSIEAATVGLLINGSDTILDVQLSALQTDGKLNILSSPSIATLDNSEAVIESGKEIPYQTIEDGTITVKYKTATLKLTVVPHVISDRMIKLNIEAKKDEVDTTNTINGNPYIIKKLATTQLIVENNKTVVLAGLSKETRLDRDTGVPGLKDIPILGHLFGKESKSTEFEELLIFITPTILTRTAGYTE